ncbi:MAG: DUF2922 domain-containing protein [Cellulosilyticaceae bacterium]
MEVKKRLLMTFKTDGERNVSIGVDDPRTDLTEAEIINAMDIILTKNVFSPKGETFVAKVGAKVVETGTQEFDLVL